MANKETPVPSATAKITAEASINAAIITANTILFHHFI